MGPRGEFFTAEFMTKNFESMHQYACSRESPVPKMGYPDMGQGIYSKKLPYKEWYEFNVTQRIHNNSLEHMSWFLPLLFVGGIFKPRLAASVAGVVFVGREFYRIGYLTKEGPSSVIREIGAVPVNVSEIFLILGISSIYLRRRFGSFFENRKFV